MKQIVQTGDACVNVSGEIRSIHDAVTSVYDRERIAGLLTLERHLREEIAHAGEMMAHDAMRDQRDFADESAEGELQ